MLVCPWPSPLRVSAGVYQELNSLHQVYSVNPIFGIDFVHEEKQKSLEEVTVKREMDDVEIDDGVVGEGGGDVFAAYYAEGSGEKATDRPVVFEPTIGLAMESLKADFTIESLWSVL